MTRCAVIVDAVRTPSGKGKAGGGLSGVHPVDLLASVLQSLMSRNDLDPGIVDDVIGGCVSQGGEQAANVTRRSVLAAGFPESVPATTIDRQCGSSQQAIHFAAQGVMAGCYDVVVACGVESMSRVPMLSQVGDSDQLGVRLRKRYAERLVPQGLSAELLAHKYGFSRELLDEYSATSHSRAVQAASTGQLDREIVPVVLPDGTCLEADETMRADTTTDKLATLPPAFATESARAQHPHLPWVITAGNSSPLTDGASAVLIMSEDQASQLGCHPRARFVSFSVAGDDPVLMLRGVVPATHAALKRAGLSIEEIDAYEVNEAFAPVPLAWHHDLGASLERLNQFGGAIAFGHALGSSGTRLMTTLLTVLERTGGKYGLQTMCEAGGMANATVIESLHT